MAFSISNTLGVDLTNVQTPSDVKHKLGTQVWGDDGKLYVFAKANAAIAASTAVCTVSASTFLATATGGAYTSPPSAMDATTNTYGWFSKASV